eukprot:350542-Chlamydomonas_euryale.AAC.7
MAKRSRDRAEQEEGGADRARPRTCRNKASNAVRTWMPHARLENPEAARSHLHTRPQLLPDA